ncbi:MAG: CaiB/BaiF CoA transferase family protein [Acidimicrobiia bacterium]
MEPSSESRRSLDENSEKQIQAGVAVELPLAGIRVIEAGAYITAPFSALMLAQLGAHVVKIEPPRGDPFRRFYHRYRGLSAAWVNVNQGKDTVSLDLKSAAGQEALRAMLSDTDVFVQNWRPGVAESFGLNAEQLVRDYSRLVFVSISGFGATGPRAAGPVFDTILQATSGMSVLESRTESPTVLRSYLADKITAMYGVQAILSALVRRDRTGLGGHVEIAMLDAMAHFNFPDLFQERTFIDDELRPVTPPPTPAILRTVDGHVCIAPVQGRQIAAAVSCLGHPEWISKLKAIGSGAELIAELVRLAEPETRLLTSDECVQRFSDADVPATRVLTPDEHLVDKQTLHNGLYDEVPTAFGRIRRVRHPMLIDGTTLPHLAPLSESPVAE